jgi:DNA-binding Lrp family transcriptional regulator
VGAEAGVNHSYLREDDWNLWFVATAPTAAALEQTLARISERTELRVLDLRLVRPFNIDLGFSLSGGQAPATARLPLRPDVLTPEDAPVLQALSEGLALVPRPFAALAASLGWHQEALIERLRILQSAGIITRLGVIVLHRGMGWTANAMIVWDIAEEKIAEAGLLAAACPGVTLCYQRRTVPGLWPYALYTMVHARARDEALAVLEMLKVLPPFSGVPHRVLFSTRCFKQTGALLHQREAAA